MEEKKNRRGGLRSRHRPKGEPTVNITIRYKKTVIDAIKKKYPNRGEFARLAHEWLDGLI